LRPKLGLSAGIELQQRFRNLLQQEPRPSMPEITGLLCENYLLVGVAEWTLADEMGPIPVSRDSVTRYLLGDFDRSKEVGDKADELYFESVLGPLVASLRTSLLGTPAKRRTSATNGSSAKPRKRSKPSSTSTTRTGGTGATTS
jgi:hypothetical protein